MIKREYIFPAPEKHHFVADTGRIVRNHTLVVGMRNYRWWNLRLHIGMVFVMFGLWITGMGFEFQRNTQPQGDDEE